MSGAQARNPHGGNDQRVPRPGDGRATLTWVAKEDFCEGGRSALSPESQRQQDVSRSGEEHSGKR